MSSFHKFHRTTAYQRKIIDAGRLGFNISSIANKMARLSIDDFKQYFDRRGSGFCDLGECTKCNTLCQIIRTKTGFPMLVNLADNQKHRLWEDKKFKQYKCNIPNKGQSSVDSIKNERKNRRISKLLNQEVVIQKPSPDDFIVYDEPIPEGLKAIREN